LQFRAASVLAGLALSRSALRVDTELTRGALVSHGNRSSGQPWAATARPAGGGGHDRACGGALAGSAFWACPMRLWRCALAASRALPCDRVPLGTQPAGRSAPGAIRASLMCWIPKEMPMNRHEARPGREVNMADRQHQPPAETDHVCPPTPGGRCPGQCGGEFAPADRLVAEWPERKNCRSRNKARAQGNPTTVIAAPTQPATSPGPSRSPGTLRWR